MRLIVFLGALLLASPAFASSDLIVTFCKSQPDPRACIRGFIDEQAIVHQEAQARWNQQHEFMRQQQFQAQLEHARVQSNGLALFGSGAAMINGVNQGFQNMQQPYVNTPFFSVQPR